MKNLHIPHKSNLSHSYLIRPNVLFTTQHKHEDVILVVRKHPVTQVPWILNLAFFIIITVILNFFLPQFLGLRQMIVANSFALFFIFSYGWVNFLLWYFSVGVITNERVIDLDLYNVLYKEFAATTIAQISDITTSVGGFTGSLFSFGNVAVKTEGFQQNIEFYNIPYPADVVKILNELMPKTVLQPKNNEN